MYFLYIILAKFESVAISWLVFVKMITAALSFCVTMLLVLLVYFELF